MTRNPLSSAALLAACLAVLVAQLDSSIVNLVLPRLHGEFGAGVTALQWVLDAYNLTYAAFLLPGGALADRAGRRRVFTIGLILLGTAALGCAVAPGAGSLVAARAVAGLGAALAMPASLAIVNLAFPEPSARGRALGLWAGCNGAALAIGPTLGGWMVDALGWRSVFLALVPLPAAAALLARRSVAESTAPAARPPSGRSQALAVLALAALAAAAIGTPEAVRGETAAILPAALGTVAVLALAVLGRLEAASAVPLLPRALLRAPGFSAALGATAAMTFGIYGMLMLVPLHLMGVRGLGVAATGLVPLPLPLSLAFVVVSSRSGTLAAAAGHRTAVAVGLALMAAGLVTAAASVGGSGLAPLIGALALTGMGLGLTTGPVVAVATAAAPEGEDGLAAALVNVARMAGATLGVAVLGAAYAALGGLAGIRLRLLLGGAVHLAGAALALRGMARDAPPARMQEEEGR
jgi:MFS transporter, DHA2 family, methylenomycin A resistance protein